ncbi:thymidine phosphorylase [Alisedimentitalea sp. MJ-SS2]|uniref:thymidine phosphorylase n=1 Tax=Aliisedimentitalea sp. MJ-SS2 TaxID=3049795 RepID=UPI0029153630|nr:thymidine phosphorylase [Alisedimentitalea sp. MJ-SS2]MDU8929894.1 thymidine phosphorylase [Alisedimentitalea sp. MJ-SS2]
MDARRIIAHLRDGQTPTQDELSWFAKGLADQSVSDAQAGAFAMAALLNGLGEEGRVALTLAMRDSGDVLQWTLDKPVLDKHSTGGVGDCVSLVLAPALAVCGAYVPMISGRGLGHTGGTLDKIESIPGLRTDLGESGLRHVVKDAGAAIVSASSQIAPADKRLYAIRDVTATVESLDLITASILSKKLAAGLEGLVLDVKVGSGAFMKTADDARALATSLVNTANAAGCPTTAIISDMNQPLVPSLGNALEVAEVMRTLTEQRGGPMAELCAALGGVVLANAGLCPDVQDGANAIAACIRDGRAAEAFGRMIAAQGGPVQFVDNWQRFLPEATVIREVTARESGIIAAYQGESLGLTVVGLGGGRQVETDMIDHSVGLSDLLPLGSKVTKGQPIARIHASREDSANRAEAELRAAMTIAPKPADIPPLIHERIG